ncbi:uncharacterized protein LOC126988221 [Eriocheir sinensis]|uniref:uncharacterized protein LOC126988221 n=1 Tax=Eriocheir sinensis TaxID=95602 RepID=UPI0021CA4640|nr:uncharacterized protein LOC126988221 [Eriocheir sinensis]
MLPPDTSSTLFPWRVVVAAMQVHGCFPFRMSATSDLPTFSLPLCLWSLFPFLAQVAWICMSFEEYVLRDFSLDVGTIAYVTGFMLLSVSVCLTPVVVGVKSAGLARLLNDLSKVTGVSPPHSYRWYCKPKTQLIMFGVIGNMILSLYATVQLGFTTAAHVVFIFIAAILFSMDFFLPDEVFSMVCGLLGRRLVTATEATVATLSMVLASDGSFKSEGDLEAAMVRLRDLDVVIREVRSESTAPGTEQHQQLVFHHCQDSHSLLSLQVHAHRHDVNPFPTGGAAEGGRGALLLPGGHHEAAGGRPGGRRHPLRPSQGHVYGRQHGYLSVPGLLQHGQALPRGTGLRQAGQHG